MALRRGVQAPLLQLGHMPRLHQTCHSTAATHRSLATRSIGRTFNAEYAAMIRHFGIEPRTAAVGAKEQNGDVESVIGRSSGGWSRHAISKSARLAVGPPQGSSLADRIGWRPGGSSQGAGRGREERGELSEVRRARQRE